MEKRLVHQYPKCNSLATPGKIAVLDGRQEISYRDLSIFSNKLSHCLEDHGIRRHDKVMLCVQRTVMCLPAILGILKADAVYVPLDPKAPLERWRRLMDDCEPDAFVCDSFTAGKAVEVLYGRKEIPLICIEPRNNNPILSGRVTLEDVESYGEEERSYENSEEDIAYIMYTSGSTGQPKGVMISHKNIETYIEWAVNCFGIGENDRILGTAPFHFDMSTFDVYCSLKAGATLCIAPDNLVLFPEKLFKFVEEQKVTLWKGISSLLMYMERAGVVQAGRIPSMKKILFGGENLPSKYLIRWMESFPEKSFYNVYGPTETTGVSLYFHVREVPKNPRERIPIGIPRHITPVCLLNDDHLPVQMGEVGELFISGAGVSKGYLNDPEKTERVFIANPITRDPLDILYATGDLAIMRADGNYEFIGRKDHQVKIMGHRIELGEIELTLLSHHWVKDCAVIPVSSREDEFEELIGFVEMENGRNSREVISFIQSKLPTYMVPKKLVEVNALPRNDRGKIDRKAIIDNYLNT